MNESSGYIIPKWVKYLEKNGTNLDFFNFSISDSPIIYDDQIPEFFPWCFLNWDNIKVIDQYQLTFLKENLINVPKQIEITGVPFYTDKHMNLEESNDYVCLFDIRAKPEHFGISTLNELGSNSFNYQEEIIKSMLTFSDMTGIKVFYKQKRYNDVNFLSDETFKMVYQAEKNNTFRLIDYRVSPHKLIKGSLGVVSQAFTTTSIIAKDFNKPNVIVDLSSKLRSNDPCVRGVDIVNDSESLLAWLFQKLQITRYPEISR
jgi:polysaccharide biosynthesis PFTS motif protein